MIKFYNFEIRRRCATVFQSIFFKILSVSSFPVSKVLLEVASFKSTYVILIFFLFRCYVCVTRGICIFEYLNIYIVVL